jgi:threonine dehydratase
MTAAGPDIADVRALRARLAKETTLTPVIRCAAIEELLDGDTRVFAKLEFLQRTGTFKARGALATMYALSPEQLSAGVTAVSAGNHAIAVAFAAQALGTTAKLVMIARANPSRIQACRSFGAEVVLADDVHEAFDVAEKIQREEGRYLVHPFEGSAVATATGTVGLEICEQCDAFDVIIVPVGGGGLIGGIANAVKRLRPACEVIGVEPEGADTMHKSLACGEPMKIDAVRTIADSLGAPFALPFSFGLCQMHVDRLAMVSDLQLRRAMGILFRPMKIAVEPACAATTAALLGPLKNELSGKRIMLVMCGSNIDWATFEEQAIFDDDVD